MKQVHPSYSFVASTKTITLTGLNIDQDQLLLIVNATRGMQYFNFADSSLRAVVTPGANTTVVLTDASTTGHANGDALVIYYDDQAASQVVSGTVTANPGAGAFTVSGTVGLDNASLVALENITVTVGSSVSVSNFPASQTIAGTVTANIGPNTAELRNEFGYYPVEIANTSTTVPISGTVTASVADLISQGTDGEGGQYRKGVQLIGLNWDNDGNRPVQTDNVGQLRVVAGSDSQNFPISGTVTVGNVEGWGIPLHDYRSFSYSGGNLSTIAYKTGGASGTTVGILTLAYDGNGNLTSMIKS